MKSLCDKILLPQFLSLISLLLFITTVAAKDICAKPKWTDPLRRRSDPTSTAAIPQMTLSIHSLINNKTEPGQINCRYAAETYSDVNYYTCTELATTYGISVERFFKLNPTIDADCGNILPNSVYCVSGFVEPVRAVDGLCGPKNNNATCLGYSLGQCCNAATGTCGNSTEDCAPGNCWGGTCVGDDVYSTDGTCGSQHGNRLCIGEWGDCCNMNGTCGTGSEFCGIDVCQMGNCTLPAVPSPPPMGNTTDGTCGGPNSFVCNVAWGNCCNKNNVCGSLPTDCGLKMGCQPEWGTCDQTSTTTSTTPVSSSLSPTTTSSSSIESTTYSTTPHTTETTSETTQAISETAIYSTPTSTYQMSTPASSLTTSSTPCSTPPDTSSSISSPSLTSTSSSVLSIPLPNTSPTSCSTSTNTTSTITSTSDCGCSKPTITGLSALPPCAQLCFNNMLAQTSSLGCPSNDHVCLCNKINFHYGIRDCSNEACGAAIASSLIAFSDHFCAEVMATATGILALPSCGQTCFSNMLDQYKSLGCEAPTPDCLCGKVDFGYGLRDCSEQACGSEVASSVVAFGSSYCGSVASASTGM